MPGKPFQSKLLPHLEFIRECRTRGMGYQLIAVELRTRFGLKTAPANVFSFVKVRARRRPLYALPAPAPAAAPAHFAAPSPNQPAPTAGVRDHWKSYDPAKPLVKDTL